MFGRFFERHGVTSAGNKVALTRRLLDLVVQIQCTLFVHSPCSTHNVCISIESTNEYIRQLRQHQTFKFSSVGFTTTPFPVITPDAHPKPGTRHPIRDAQPAWLRKGRSFQRRRRTLELHVESCREGVTVAKEYCQHLKTRGRAFGDPVLALVLLEKQLEEAERAVRGLELRRSEFLEVQAKVEVPSVQGSCFRTPVQSSFRRENSERVLVIHHVYSTNEHCPTTFSPPQRMRADESVPSQLEVNNHCSFYSFTKFRRV